MKCRNVREKLALYAGGDLPEAEISELERHLDGCRSCTQGLDQLRRAINAVEQINEADIPDPLPDRMVSEIYQRATQAKSKSGSLGTGKPRWRFAVAFGAIGLILVLIVALAGNFREDKIQAIIKWHHEWLRTAGENRSDIQWEAMRSLSGIFGSPIRLKEWTPPNKAGVYAIMHRADSGGGPVKYTVDYCGESRKLGAFQTYPWLPQVQKRLVSRTGSTDNVYIAVILMPESTGDERRAVEEVIIKAFNPYFNRQKGA